MAFLMQVSVDEELSTDFNSMGRRGSQNSASEAKLHPASPHAEETPSTALQAATRSLCWMLRDMASARRHMLRRADSQNRTSAVPGTTVSTVDLSGADIEAAGVAEVNEGQGGDGAMAGHVTMAEQPELPTHHDGRPDAIESESAAAAAALNSTILARSLIGAQKW
jgi:hypothetical protein